ncbi:MAG: NAD(P)H-hydrate dehydratase [Verrucomicrobiae bacterium]|nr:NAD(P)H-hydrate dehydratase [Verrucomicrobiae bacterium]
MIVTCEAIQEAEKRVFAAGVESEPLMEEAGWGCACAIRQFFPRPGLAVLFIGKGNNGGDALVIGRHLRRWGWQVSARLACEPEEGMTELAALKLAEFEAEEEFGGDPGGSGGALIAIDGLLGIGARGPLRGVIGELAEEMNAFRLQENAVTFAVDIPSGVDGNSGEPCTGAVMADITLSISAIKAGLVADAAIDHVGRLVQIPMPEIAAEILEKDDSALVIGPDWVASRLPRRSFSSHKGQTGRVAIIAGSRGLTGAARLCGLGALRGGAGLVTVFVHESIYDIVATAAPAEVMVRPTADFSEITDFHADVIAMGPGLGEDPAQADALLQLMRSDPRPLVIDADALNLLSRQPGDIEAFSPAGPRLLTPHPGELTRLLGGKLPSDQERIDIARDTIERCPVTLLFKGARTVVAERNQPTAINPTGHPGMATGGIGDVLTGLCAALIGQRLTPYDAAATGSWLIGRSAEIALTRGASSPESLSAGMIADFLGAAFDSARAGEF